MMTTAAPVEVNVVQRTASAGVIPDARQRAPRVVFPAWRSAFERWWIPWLVLPMMMASDYKFRRRSAASALGGKPDAQVLIEVGVYGLVALYLLLARGRAPRLKRTTPIMFAMWFFGAALAVSATYAVYPTLAIVRGTQVLIVCAVAQTVAMNATIKDLHRFAHAYLAMLSLSIAVGHAHKFPVNPVVNSRFHWLYVHPVPGAIYLMIGTVLIFGYVRSSALREVLAIWPRWVYNAMAGWILIALLLSKTRGSLGGALVGGLMLIVFRTRTRTKLDVAAFAAAAVTFAAFVFGPAIVSYIERGQDISKLSTLNERTNLWALAFDSFFHNPIWGRGLGASRGLFLEEIGLGGGHNAFVNVLVDAGLLGTIPFVAILVLVGYTLYRFPPRSAAGRDAVLLLPVFFGLLTNSMTAEFMAVPANNASIWLFMLCAWVTVLQRERLLPGAKPTGLNSDERTATARAAR